MDPEAGARTSQSSERRYGALPSPEVTPAMRALIGGGRVFSLQQPMLPDMPQWTAQPAYSLTTVLTHDESGAILTRPATGSFERIEHSGHSGTHIDALCHVGCWHDDQPYLHGDVPARAIATPEGYRELAAEHFPPIIVRGILLDVAAAKGVAYLPDLYEITAADLQQCEEAQGVRVAPDSAVLIRTGFARFWRDDPTHYMGKGPGPGPEAARYLAARGCVATGSDTANYEVLNFPVLSVHVILLYEHGIPIMENLRLDELSAAGVHEFLYVALPIAYTGSTGSNIHPIAIA